MKNGATTIKEGDLLYDVRNQFVGKVVGFKEAFVDTNVVCVIDSIRDGHRRTINSAYLELVTPEISRELSAKWMKELDALIDEMNSYIKR